jgi:hypothetical protein
MAGYRGMARMSRRPLESTDGLCRCDPAGDGLPRLSRPGGADDPRDSNVGVGLRVRVGGRTVRCLDGLRPTTLGGSEAAAAAAGLAPALQDNIAVREGFHSQVLRKLMHDAAVSKVKELSERYGDSRANRSVGFSWRLGFRASGSPCSAMRLRERVDGAMEASGIGPHVPRPFATVGLGEATAANARAV